MFGEVFQWFPTLQNRHTSCVFFSLFVDYPPKMDPRITHVLSPFFTVFQILQDDGKRASPTGASSWVDVTLLGFIPAVFPVLLQEFYCYLLWLGGYCGNLACLTGNRPIKPLLVNISFSKEQIVSIREWFRCAVTKIIVGEIFGPYQGGNLFFLVCLFVCFLSLSSTLLLLLPSLLGFYCCYCYCYCCCYCCCYFYFYFYYFYFYYYLFLFLHCPWQSWCSILVASLLTWLYLVLLLIGSSWKLVRPPCSV